VSRADADAGRPRSDAIAYAASHYLKHGMAAGLTEELLSMEHLCTIIDAASPAKKRGPYKKQAA
jgi:hypothetical protein